MTWALESFKNFHFNGLLLSKVYIVQVKKVQRSYLSGNWRKILIWRGIDLSFQNWHKEYDKFWPEHSKVSKFSTLMGFFWTKYIVQAKKVQRSYLSWNWRRIQKFGEESTCHFKIDIRNLTNFDLSTRKFQNVSL